MQNHRANIFSWMRRLGFRYILDILVALQSKLVNIVGTNYTQTLLPCHPFPSVKVLEDVSGGNESVLRGNIEIEEERN